MLVDSNQIIPITRLQKELTRRVREISETGIPLYILKNNNMEAVMVPFSEYEHLREMEEVVEQFEIKEMLDQRIESYNNKNSLSWENVREEI